MKIKLFLLPLICILCMTIACGCSDQNRTIVSESSDSSTSAESNSRVSEIYDIIGGDWKISGLYHDDEKYSFDDPKYFTLAKLYKNYYLYFNEDGTFVYSRGVFVEKGNYGKSDSSENSIFIDLKSESGYRNTIKNGEIVREDVSTDNCYRVEIKDEGEEIDFFSVNPNEVTSEENSTIFVLQNLEESTSKTEYSNDEKELNFQTIKDAQYQMPRDWKCVKAEKGDTSATNNYSPSGSEEKLHLISVNWFTLSNANEPIKTKAKAKFVLENIFSTYFSESYNYSDTTYEEYTLYDNPAFYGTANSNRDTVTTAYLFMGSSVRDFFLLTYTKSNTAKDDYTPLIGEIARTIKLPVFKLDTDETVNNDVSKKEEEKESKDSETSIPSYNMTGSQQQALQKALDYLEYSAFSYDGLINQLEFEGFSSSDSKFAVDNCGADWNKQALIKALDYLDYSSFSYSGLIEQLTYEGFTSSQAKYGVDNCEADWNTQAALKAKEYLEYMDFSKNELIEQLEYEGFTSSQAKYGASHTH